MNVVRVCNIRLAAALGCAISLTIAIVSVVASPPAWPADLGASGSDEPLARGRYLVTVAGCNDCHTPWKVGPAGPEPDTSRMLSGHPESFEMPPPPVLPADAWAVTVARTNTAWSGPWGVSFTANLTPDPETGLGRWTLRNFTDTIRSGRHMGRGRLILPPMPIPMYRHFTDADLAAIFAYLQSIPPISNRVPEPWAPQQIPSQPGSGK